MENKVIISKPTEYIRKIAAKIDISGFYNEIDNYYKYKNIYLKERTPYSSAYMKMKYDEVYTSLKGYMSLRRITEDEFWKCVDELQEDL